MPPPRTEENEKNVLRSYEIIFDIQKLLIAPESPGLNYFNHCMQLLWSPGAYVAVHSSRPPAFNLCWIIYIMIAADLYFSNSHYPKSKLVGKERSREEINVKRLHKSKSNSILFSLLFFSSNSDCLFYIYSTTDNIYPNFPVFFKYFFPFF
jgi:hypothetical protein